MPFEYSFKINGQKIYGVEHGFGTSRKWEEALDEAKLSIPFSPLSEPFPMLSLLQIEKVDTKTNKTKTHDMLILSDRVSNSTNYGYYRHDMNAIEYTSKLDYYIINSLAKSRILIDNNPAPFTVTNTFNKTGASTGYYEALAYLETLDVKTTYFSGKSITFPKRKKAYLSRAPFSVTTSNYGQCDVIIDTNAPLVSGTTPFVISEDDCTWVFPKGQWYIDYKVRVVDDDTMQWAVPDGDGDYNVYRYYINVIDEVDVTILDVINTIRDSISKFGGIESEKYYSLTRVFEVSDEAKEFLSKIPAPQMYLANATARQMLIFALSYVNALPRLMRGQDIDILELEQYNMVQGSFEQNDLSEFSGSQNTNQIGTNAFSALKQVLPDDLNEANIFSPSQSGYVSVRSPQIQITQNNFEIKLPKPIYKPIKLAVLIPEITLTGAVGLGEPPVVRKYYNEEIDLTPRWINYEEWKLKKITNNFPSIDTQEIWTERVGLRENMTSNIYWQQGDKSIKLSDIYGEVFQNTLIRNVVREAIYEKFMRDMPMPSFYDDSMILDYSIEFDLPPNTPGGALEWQFRVEYISDENLNVKVDKEDLTQIDFYSEMKHNQDESLINVVRASRKIYGDLQRTGNKNFSFTKYHTTFDDMYDIGQQDVNGYTITSINQEHYNEYIISTYFVTKYHNRIQQATYIDQTYRWRDNYAKTVLDRHENYSDYIIIVPPNDKSVTQQLANKVNGQYTLKVLFRNIGGTSSLPIKNTKATNAFVRTDGMFEVESEELGSRWAVNTPVSSYGIKGSLAFTFGFNANMVAGDEVLERNSKYWNSAVRYTNAQGRFTRFGFWILSDYEFLELDKYPRVNGTLGLFDPYYLYFGCGSLNKPTINYLGDDPLVVEKDTMTNFNLTYQLHIISHYTNLYILGLNFYTKNYLVNNPNGDERTFLHIYNDGTRYEMFEDMIVKDGANNIVELNETNWIYNNTLNNVRFNGISLVGATSWAIANQDGELLIACNEPLNGFDTVVRHFRPSVSEIGRVTANDINLNEEFSLTDDISISQFVFPILNINDIININSEIEEYRSTDVLLDINDTVTINSSITGSQFIFPIINLEDVISIASSIEASKTENTNIEIGFAETITLGSSINSEMSITMSINLEDTITLNSTIDSEKSTDYVTTLSDNLLLESDITATTSKYWYYLGTITTTYSLETEVYSYSSTCPTSVMAESQINTEFPPNDYTTGTRIRVERTRDGGTCFPLYYYYEVREI